MLHLLMNTFGECAHSVEHIIFFQLQIVLIPGKMDLKFTEINVTEMYVANFHT